MGFSAEEFDLNFKPHRDQGGILIISFKLARIPLCSCPEAGLIQLPYSMLQDGIS